MPDRDARHPIFARYYAWASPRMEHAGYADCRARLLAGLAGRVVEVGAGNGLNFAHYPAAVTRVLAVEPEPRLRDQAAAAAERAPVPVEVVAGTADRLPTGDATCDAAVASLVLCTVPDVPAALAEVRRVLRPGGQLRFLEHVRAATAGLARVQRALDATVGPALCGGCHAHRDTLAAIEAAGFTIEDVARARIPPTGVAGPTALHVLGVATTPGG